MYTSFSRVKENSRWKNLDLASSSVEPPPPVPYANQGASPQTETAASKTLAANGGRVPCLATPRCIHHRSSFKANQPHLRTRAPSGSLGVFLPAVFGWGESGAHRAKLEVGVLSVIEQTLASSTLLANSDCKLTVLIAVRYPDVEIYAHLEEMKPRLAGKPVHVTLSSNSQVSRHNAEAKDSQWVDDRVQVVDPKAEETLLLDSTLGEILEGSQTNFFAVNDQGQVVTAKTGILLGTVRAAVMDACRALEIPVVESPPLVKQIPHFAEAFLASTSRLVLPIDTIGDVALPADRPITQKIVQWVNQHVDDRSISPRQLLRKL
ncbi:hypothetical protein BASA81_010382 [Batrachochytrium salamandrivorans]|nr:hypothetical protein BASA81_010382 [Batrachochytrium salamandrivorans]